MRDQVKLFDCVIIGAGGASLQIRATQYNFRDSTRRLLFNQLHERQKNVLKGLAFWLISLLENTIQ
jgi:ribosomal silencing factor RsfS